MPEPTAALHALRASTADFVHGLELEQWSDDDLEVASLCPGWTRADVLAHVARGADDIAAILAGALRGEVVAPEAEAAGGGSRPVGALIADLAESAERLDRVMAAVSDAGGWQRPAGDRHADEWVSWRLREVEIHRVDLAGTYTPDRWPPFLVAELLPSAAASLESRCDGSGGVEVRANGGVVPELDGAVWEAGPGEPTVVAGPDWAILAWLVGRDSQALDALTATPPLTPWA